MPNTDMAVLLQQPSNPTEHVVKELRIIAMLLRQGFNITEAEDTSLSQQDLPATSTTGAL